MTTHRTTILLDADLLERLDRHVRRERTTKTADHLRRDRGVAGRARGGARVPVRRDRTERARTPVAGRAGDRAPRGRPAARRTARWRSCSTRRRSSPPPTRRTSTTGRRSPGSRAADEPLLLGALGLAELDLLLQRELGATATEAVLQALVADAIRLVPPTREDLARAMVLMRDAAEHRPRLADALLVATAERLGVRRGRGLRPAAARGLPAAARAGAGVRALGIENGAGGPAPFGRCSDRPGGQAPTRLITTVLAWTSWKPWRLGLWDAVYSRYRA